MGTKGKQANDRVKLMYDSAPFGTFFWSEDGRVIDCNQAVMDLFGLDSKAECAERFFEFSPEFQPDGSPSRERALALVAQVTREGAPLVFEWMHQNIDGEPRPVEITLVRVLHNERHTVIGYSKDLREHKRMMAEIERRDHLFSTVNRAAAILLQSDLDEFEGDMHRCMGMLAESMELDRVYIWKNHMVRGQRLCTQIFEWSGGAEPQQGKDLTVDVSYSDVMPAWEEALSRGRCVNGIVSSMSPKARAHLSPQGILSLFVAPVFLRDAFWGFIGYDDCHHEREFTENEQTIMRSGGMVVANALLRNDMMLSIRDTAAQLEMALEKAQDANRAKSEFLAHMSHEIRTPMNAILGITRIMLRDEQNLPKSIYENIVSIKQEGSNLLRLINDILDFSKIESGKLELLPAEYQLASLVHDVVNLIRSRAADKSLLFRIEVDHALPGVLIGDMVRVRQVVLNLLVNAVKYTERGHISLTMSGERLDDGQLRLEVSVEDTGVGIRERDMEDLFQRFTQFHMFTNGNVTGTGLGLAITRSLCREMGGDVTVSSQYGVGSVFCATLLQTVKDSAPLAVVKNPERNRILVFDSRSVLSSAMSRCLTGLGVLNSVADSFTSFEESLSIGGFTHLFVAAYLYNERLRRRAEGTDIKIVVFTDFGEIAPPDVCSVNAPSHAISMANLLNGVMNPDGVFDDEEKNGISFTAPSALVLIVDDLATNLRVAKGLIEPYGVQVDMAAGGREAIQLIKERYYDIVFMDHMMPDMDGLRATAAIRAMNGDRFQSLPIVALTANAIIGMRETFLRNGFNDYIAKPIEVSKLNEIMERWIPKEKHVYTPKRKKSALPEQNLSIEGLDVARGVALTGGTEKGYREVLALFNMNANRYLKEFSHTPGPETLRSFITQVHALKSASATIGALNVSHEAALLEKAGKEGDQTALNGRVEAFHAKLSQLTINIREALAKAAPPDQTREWGAKALWRLRIALEDEDIQTVDRMLTQFAVVGPADQSAAMEAVVTHVLSSNYGKAIEQIDLLLEAR